jgi:hypothetical protein
MKKLLSALAALSLLSIQALAAAPGEGWRMGEATYAATFGGTDSGAYASYVLASYEAEFPGELDAVGIPWALMALGGGSVEERAAGEAYHGDVEAVRRDLALSYLSARRSVAETHDAALSYRAQYPGTYEDYDPYADYTPDEERLIQITMDRYGLQTEEEFKEYCYVRSMAAQYPYEQSRAAKLEEVLALYPEQYAAFDPYAWFAGYYGNMGTTPEDYMERAGLDEIRFRQAMFLEWADRASTGFFGGYCVTVNGTPIQFQLYRGLSGKPAVPVAEHDRLLVPLRAAAEALGLTVEWRLESNEILCAGAETAVTFTLGSTQYSGGTLDVAPYAQDGNTYLPIRALGESLGCQVTWDQDFATAALTAGSGSR